MLGLFIVAAAVAIGTVLGAVATRRRGRPADADRQASIGSADNRAHHEDNRAHHEDKRAHHEDKRAHHEDKRAHHEDKRAHHEDKPASPRGSPRDTPDPASAGASAGSTPSPLILLVGVDGGGTSARCDVPAVGWTPEAVDLLGARRRCVQQIRGVDLHVNPIAGGVHLRAPGRVLLAIHPDHARIVVPTAALDQGLERWIWRWFGWASGLLLGAPAAQLSPRAAGWETWTLDAHIDATHVEIPDAWVVLEDAWTGRSARRRPNPDGFGPDGRLLGWWIGSKVDAHGRRGTAVALHAYRKDTLIAEQTEGREAANRALLATYAAAGHDGVSPVWRFEASLRASALQLEGPGGEWDLRDPLSWIDDAAIRAALAYVIGVEGHRHSGVIRLTDDTQRDKPAKRRDPHPLWVVLRAATEGAPRTRLIQVSRSLDRADRADRAERAVGRALGQLAGVAGATETPEQAAGFAVAAVPRIVRRDDWPDHVGAARVDHADLHDHEK